MKKLISISTTVRVTSRDIQEVIKKYFEGNFSLLEKMLGN